MRLPGPGGAPGPRARARPARCGDGAGYPWPDALPRARRRAEHLADRPDRRARRRRERRGAPRHRPGPVAPSCSLLHVPFDLEGEAKLDAELRSWLAFAPPEARRGGDPRPGRRARPRRRRRGARGQRRGAREPPIVAPDIIGRGRAAPRRSHARRCSPASIPTPTRARSPAGARLRSRCCRRRPSARSPRRRRAQGPGVVQRPGSCEPTNTTPSSRTTRRGAFAGRRRSGSTCSCTANSSATTWSNISANKLDGFAFTENGWVQSYGSRCVKPPIIFGDVARRGPMTVEWSRYAQSLTAQADEGDADRAGDDPAMVVRARRPAAHARPAGRSRWPSATKWRT